MYEYEEQLDLLIKSGSKLIQVVSFEWQRVQGFINQVAKNHESEWWTWSRIKGLWKWNAAERTLQEEDDEMTDPINVLAFFETQQRDFILILEDFYPFFTERSPEVIRYLREIARGDFTFKKTIILSQPIKRVPEELSKDMAVIEVALPRKETIKSIVEDVLVDYPDIPSHITEKLLSSALGLTVMEARLAFKKAIHKYHRLTEAEIPMIISEKENIIKKSGLLEYYHPKESLGSVGGLQNLKEWVERRGQAFSESAREFGLNVPKGVLLLGIPGCGKSLTAKVIAKSWNFPLLRFDLGKVFGGLVGESERNIREALDVAKALSPCVLWIDEIEKGLSGVKSSGMSDGGTSSRVFGTFLTWMQEKEEPVFVVATANDISLLPPELLRKGRFDEIFFVDLPTKVERDMIFRIHLEKKNRRPENYDLEQLASSASGYTGAEIEEIVNEALFRAFNENRDLETTDMLNSIAAMSPLSKTMAEVIKDLRKWAKARARLASISDAEPLSEQIDKTPVLKQERRNPFFR